MTRVAATDSVTVAFFLILAAVLVESAYTSISAVVKAELFPTRLRSLGVALPYALANALFGGTAEYVALWCKSAGAESGFYAYASGLSAVSFVAALALKDTRRHSRIIED
jgi:MHS family alpha-ketoglutarate permease-like MFS transporter